MTKILYESTEAKLSYYKKEKVLELIWIKQVSDLEYKKVFSEALNAAKSYKCSSFISDMRNEGLISISNVRWLQKEILPHVKKLGITKIALVVSDNLYTQIYAQHTKKMIMEIDIPVQIFENYNNAMNWLKEI